MFVSHQRNYGLIFLSLRTPGALWPVRDRNRCLDKEVCSNFLGRLAWLLSATCTFQNRATYTLDETIAVTGPCLGRSLLHERIAAPPVRQGRTSCEVDFMGQIGSGPASRQSDIKRRAF